MRVGSPYCCLGQWTWTPASVLPSPFSTIQPNCKLPLDWHASFEKTRGAGAINEHNVLGAPRVHSLHPSGLPEVCDHPTWGASCITSGYPKIHGPVKAPSSLGTNFLCKEGWYRVKMTPEQQRRQVHKQARLCNATQRDMPGGRPGQRSWECIQRRPTAQISLLQKNVLGVTHDCEKRYQIVVSYWSIKQIYFAEPEHPIKQTLTLNFCGKGV